MGRTENNCPMDTLDKIRAQMGGQIKMTSSCGRMTVWLAEAERGFVLVHESQTGLEANPTITGGRFFCAEDGGSYPLLANAEQVLGKIKS